MDRYCKQADNEHRQMIGMIMFSIFILVLLCHPAVFSIQLPESGQRQRVTLGSVAWPAQQDAIGYMV